jgi:RNA polymerase sigma factor (sigma-70 family)
VARQCYDDPKRGDVTVTENELLAEHFERLRPRLHAVAYRMLGSRSEADDAVQECWLRLNRSEADGIDNLGGWLTTVVGRIALDMLRTRAARREDSIDSWLPEPVVTLEEPAAGPQEQTLVADSVGLALLVILETLTPAERVAFVLHDMFGLSFAEIAPIVERSPAAARQLASRARRRVRGADLEADADLPTQRRLVSAFLAASREGDLDALIAVLDPEVVFRIDAGAAQARARAPVHGAEAVARRVLAQGTPFAPYARQALVNGSAGAVVAPPGRRPFAVVSFTVRAGKIASINLVLDPEKLAVTISRH